MASSMASVNSTHPNGPMHQPQSTISVGNILSIKLRGRKTSNNYELWRAHMYRFLKSRNLLGYVDGRISPPDPFVRSPDEISGDTRAVHEINRETDKEYERADPPSRMIWNPDYEVWRRSDTLVKAWTLVSLEEEVMSNVVRLEPLDTARAVWLKLEEEYAGKDFKQYLDLYIAILKADWEITERLLRKDKEAATTRINSRGETALHIAVMAKNSHNFVTILLEFMPNYSIFYQDNLGNTALHNAATAGNTAVVRSLTKKYPDLLFVSNKDGWYPVQVAAHFAKRDTLICLLQIMYEQTLLIKKVGLDLFLDLLRASIVVDFFAAAMDLVFHFPALAKLHNKNGSALSIIAKQSSAFRSGCNFNFWEGYIYDCISVGRSTAYQRTMSNIEDTENPTPFNTRVQQVIHKDKSSWETMKQFGAKYWETMMQFVPPVNKIYLKKWKHQDAVQLVKCLLVEIKLLTEPEAVDIYYSPMMLAANLGIHEVIELIVETFPEAIHCHDTGTNYNIFHTAVKNRCQDVYNLVYRMGGYKNYFANLRDNYGNSLLHICATLAPPHKLNLVSGAAFQMQRELQWFKEIEKFVPPDFREHKNIHGKTPQVIFTEEHKKLKEDGEKWMKETATSCLVAATLVVTIAFAAAITVPGGNDEKNGFPKWSKDNAFIIFVVSDAMSLFMSTTSLLLLLSIWTSRYAEEDFLYVLPKRLCIGLLTLFLSITFMMVAFNAALYLVFGQKRVWVLFLAAAMACSPIGSFVLLQFPLLVGVMYSTYGPGIFGKKSDKPFY